MLGKWLDFGRPPALPAGFRIEQICTDQGTGMGDDHWAWALQQYKPVTRRRLFRKSVTEWRWVSLAWTESRLNLAPLSAEQSARFHYHARLAQKMSGT